jgi:hypothetical protein
MQKNNVLYEIQDGVPLKLKISSARQRTNHQLTPLDPP